VQYYPTINQAFNWSFKYKLRTGAVNTDTEYGDTVYEVGSTTIYDEKAILYSAFIQDELSLFNKKLTLLPGVRVTYLDLNKQAVIEPRISMEYEFLEKNSLKAGLGRHTEFEKNPQVLEGKDLSHMRMPEVWHFVGGYERAFTRDLFLRVESFYKAYNNMIFTGGSTAGINVSSSGGGVAVGLSADDQSKQTINNMYGNSAGLEVFLELKKREDTRSSGWLSFSWLRSVRLITTQTDTTSVAPVQQWFYPDQDRRIALSAVFDHKLSDRVSFYAQFDYTTGAPYTPVASVNKGIGSDGKPSYTPVYAAYNSDRLPDYHKLDIKFDYKIARYFGIEAAAFFQLDNVYDHANVIGYDYNNDYTQKQPRTYLGFMPLFGMEVTW
jgi:hypothetical protein